MIILFANQLFSCKVQAGDGSWASSRYAGLCWSTCMSIMLFRNPNIFSGNVRFLFCVILGQNLEMKANLLLLGDMYGDDSS